MNDTFKIRQAVIPAAGLGTRFLPVTKCFPKELIPLGDKPCLQHVIDEAVAAGVEEFVIVISPGKTSLEQYFRPQPQLDEWLRKRGLIETADMLRRIETQAVYRFVIQEEPLGLGHAVACAREFVSDDYFFVILPDDIILSAKPVCAQMTALFAGQHTPVLAVLPVNWEEVHRYGIVRAAPLTDTVGDVQGIIEKPRREESPSNLAVVGRYILPRKIFTILESTPPGAGGEIQLTDALRRLLNDGGLNSLAFDGQRFDTGTPEGWLEANFAVAIRHPRLRTVMQKFTQFPTPNH